MKKLHLKRVAGILLIGALLLGSCVTAAAAEESNVIWEGNSEGIVFSSGSEYLDDLFPNMRGLMPGDVQTQTIRITNNDSRKVKLYLRAQPTAREEFASDEEYALAQKLIGELALELKLKVGAAETLIYRGPASGVPQADFAGSYSTMVDSIFLGTYSRGNDVSLIAEITAPASLGNEYQNAVAKGDWVFTGNEVKKDKDGEDPTYEIIEEDDVPLANLPQTGRSSGAVPMMGAVLLGAGVILRTRDGKKDK